MEICFTFWGLNDASWMGLDSVIQAIFCPITVASKSTNFNEDNVIVFDTQGNSFLNSSARLKGKVFHKYFKPIPLDIELGSWGFIKSWRSGVSYVTELLI